MSEDPTTSEDQAVEAEETNEETVAEVEETVAAATEVEEETTETAEDTQDTTEAVEEAAAPASSGMTIDDITPGMQLEGKVKAIQLYGAFVDIGIGQDALLHISQLGQQNVRNVEDHVKVGETIKVYVLKIDKGAGRIALSTQPTPSVTWDDIQQGQRINGTVVRIENFGVFVDVGAERPGMVHVSELAEGFVKTPSDVVSVGQEVEVRVIKVNRKKRQIDLSMKEPQEDYTAELLEDEEELPTAMEMAFRRAQRDAGGSGGQSAAAQRKNQSEKKRREQADIISRTLRGHSNN